MLTAAFSTAVVLEFVLATSFKAAAAGWEYHGGTMARESAQSTEQVAPRPDDGELALLRRQLETEPSVAAITTAWQQRRSTGKRR